MLRPLFRFLNAISFPTVIFNVNFCDDFPEGKKVEPCLQNQAF